MLSQDTTYSLVLHWTILQLVMNYYCLVSCSWWHYFLFSFLSSLNALYIVCLYLWMIDIRTVDSRSSVFVTSPQPLLGLFAWAAGKWQPWAAFDFSWYCLFQTYSLKALPLQTHVSLTRSRFLLIPRFLYSLKKDYSFKSFVHKFHPPYCTLVFWSIFFFLSFSLTKPANLRKSFWVMKLDTGNSLLVLGDQQYFCHLKDLQNWMLATSSFWYIKTTAATLIYYYKLLLLLARRLTTMDEGWSDESWWLQQQSLDTI